MQHHVTLGIPIEIANKCPDLSEWGCEHSTIGGSSVQLVGVFGWTPRIQAQYHIQAHRKATYMCGVWLN